MDKKWKKMLQRTSIFSKLILYILSQIYRIAYTTKFMLFETGLLKKVKRNVPVISVGNITVGGTGKTPLVICIANMFAEKGMKPAVLSRGYGGSVSEGVVSNGKDIYMSAAQCSDEAYLIAEKTAAAVMIGKHRRFTGREAIGKFGSNVLILDDGYQYFRMIRDCNILVINARDPFGNFKLLPAGILREPIVQIKRASLIVISKYTYQNTTAIVKIIKKYNTHAAIFYSRYAVDSLYCKNAPHFQIEHINGKEILILSSIGDPEYFEYLVEHLDCKPQKYHVCRFNDHHTYTKDEIRKTLETYKTVDYIFTTEKDHVKLVNMDVTIPLVCVSIKMEIENEALFREKISQYCNIR